MKIRKTKLAARDARGRIRQVKGISPCGKNARIQIADNETSDAEAYRRLQTIHSLYERQCKRFQLEQWANWSLSVAKEIGAGRVITDVFLMTLFSEAGMASTAVLLKEWGIPVILKSEQFQRGMDINREQIEAMVSGLVQRQLKTLTDIKGPIVDEIQLPDSMMMGESGTLFDALDAYCIYLDKTGEREEVTSEQKAKGIKGEIKAKVYKNIKDIGRLKAEFEEYVDLPLWKLDLHRWEELVAVWRNRPLTQKKKRCAKSWAEQQLKILFRFGRWLHKAPNFKWKKPDGFDEVSRKVVDLPEDDKGEGFQTITVPTYSVAELATIIKYCKPFHRAIIATCVNCAFGQSEIGQWKTSRIKINEKHLHSEKIDFESSDQDSWIVGPRPKTKRYGEHLLWSEVADALKPYLEGDVLWLTKTGKPIYKPW